MILTAHECCPFEELQRSLIYLRAKVTVKEEEKEVEIIRL